MDNSVELKINVGCLIYAVSTKRYLFLLRNRSRYAGAWGLVGGKVEANERIITALNREIMEEIGIDLSCQKTIPVETFTSADQKFVYHTYVVSVLNEFVPHLNGEHRGYCWVKLSDYPKPLHPGVWKTFNFSSVISKIKTLELVL